MLENRLLARLLASGQPVRALQAVAPVRDAAAQDAPLLRAKVTAQLADGTFRVLVDGKPLELALPAGTRPGDWIELRPSSAGAFAPAARAAGAPAANAETGLSNLGKLIASLLAGAPRTGLPPSPPLLGAPPSKAAELLQPLTRAVEESGLFYESHQARWLQADYPLARLRQEPQERIARRQLAPASAEDAAVEGVHAKAAQATDSAIAAPFRDDASERSTQVLGPEHALLVRAQLETLANRHIAWSGELWPGQSVRWEIDGDERDEERGSEAGGEWRTTLALTMPRLGAVAAALSIGTDSVRIALAAEDAARLALLRSALPQLAQALARAGLTNVHLEAASRAEER